MKAFFAGSFDPLTTGHLNLIHRASMMFDEVVVAVMVNPLKKSSLTKEKRLEHLRKCTAHMGNVRIVEEEGLTVDAAKKHVLRFIIPELENREYELFNDYKTALQEVIQRNPEERLSYVLIDESGPDHDKQFTVEVHLNSNVIGTGVGKSKKQAEQAAAHQALILMGIEE